MLNTARPKLATKSLFLVCLSGLLFGLIWPPSPLCILVPLAMVPMIILWMQNMGNRYGSLVPYLFFLGFTLTAVRWLWQIDGGPLAKFLIALAFLLIPLVQSFPFLFVGFLIKKTGWYYTVLLVPVLAVAIELLHNYWELGFTWLHMYLGISASSLEVGAYSIVGPIGTTFLIYLSNMLAAMAFQFRKKRILLWGFSGTALICLVILFFPIQNKKGTGKALKVAVAEPVYDPGKWNKDELYNHSRKIGEAIQASAKLNVDLIVFPEGYLRNLRSNQIIINDFLLNPAIRDIQRWCTEYDVHVITGAIGIYVYDSNSVVPSMAPQSKSGIYYDQYNIVLCIAPSGEIQYRAKSRLVPFMERVPFLGAFSSLEKLHLELNQSGGSYAKGTGLSSFEVKGAEVLPLICYENLFQEDFSSGLTANVDMIVEVSNEAWAKGGFMAVQHAQYGKAISQIHNLPYCRSSVGHGSGFFKNKEEEKILRTTFGRMIISTVQLE